MLLLKFSSPDTCSMRLLAGGYMCPVITCAAMFATNNALMEHIAGHDSNVSLIQKRARKRTKTSARADVLPSLARSQSFEGDVEDETGMLCAGGSYLDDDDDFDDALDGQATWLFGAEGADEEEDNDDDVYFIGHVRDGRRKRARSLSVSSDCGPPAPPLEKSFKCQHPGCGRSFNQVPGVFLRALLLVCRQRSALSCHSLHIDFSGVRKRTWTRTSGPCIRW